MSDTELHADIRRRANGIGFDVIPSRRYYEKFATAPPAIQAKLRGELERVQAMAATALTHQELVRRMKEVLGAEQVDPNDVEPE